jgi:hypothetical protein
MCAYRLSSGTSATILTIGFRISYPQRPRFALLTGNRSTGGNDQNTWQIGSGCGIRGPERYDKEGREGGESLHLGI